MQIRAHGWWPVDISGKSFVARRLEGVQEGVTTSPAGPVRDGAGRQLVDPGMAGVPLASRAVLSPG
jgi:hypothetical protein